MMTLQELTTTTDVPVLITDHQGFITFVNSAFQATFGWQSEEILGQPLTVVIPTSYHDSHHLGFARFTLTEQPTIMNHPLRLMAVTQDGREILSEHFITAEQQLGQWMFGAILRPLES
ncbi:MULTISPECIES: PAS domain-containing protein [Trichocoleus]|uniref:PAS domain-containing protein n=2 Tax=Trichocoleus TaxID=450526 RepID=A0ABV0J5B9_9CYAN|nr:PAS domain-containing protein [Trichocoleus sp. FACHB-46]MBD1861682.1 PAS domain-containing protein [Trichocoleus sp. FACHB-46]MBD2099211.1 PAS domain-containing protein [Trichocoleus sp. FACHB-591]MBD2124174.1 PAS domain-containing protein [Trichocoleus sp. FACHB-262]